MKRNKNLVLLSHDHYHGLSLANLIRKNAPVFSKLPNDIPGKLRYTLDKYDNELEQHFAEEEDILFLLAEGKSLEIDKLIEEVLEEHAVIRDIIFRLREGVDVEEDLDHLGSILERHIRKEERQLFGMIEEALTEEELEELGNRISSMRKKPRL
jgi:iron-sulfur cluster repair protein YtfE (RIC family)